MGGRSTEEEEGMDEELCRGMRVWMELGVLKKAETLDEVGKGDSRYEALHRPNQNQELSELYSSSEKSSGSKFRLEGRSSSSHLPKWRGKFLVKVDEAAKHRIQAEVGR